MNASTAFSQQSAGTNAGAFSVVMRTFLLFLFIIALGCSSISGFHQPSSRSFGIKPWFSARDDEVRDSLSADLEQFLMKYFPTFSECLLLKNEAVMKQLRQRANEGFTIFVPNEGAFVALGEKKLSQLKDPRNQETADRMGAFHVIPAEAISIETLLDENVGGVMTLGGEVQIGPSRSGGLFGFGGSSDGGVLVGSKAKIMQSSVLGQGIVHEVDQLVSPEVLWRYFDQLRIPGSR